jgi:hypothetical protein
MPALLTKMQLGYLKRLTWWIEKETVRNPFTFSIKWTQVCFERYKNTTLSTIWHNIVQDLQTYADHGYITITDEDGQT